MAARYDWTGQPSRHPWEWLRGKSSGRACGAPKFLHARPPFRLVAKAVEEGSVMIRSEILVLLILYVLLAFLMVALVVH